MRTSNSDEPRAGDRAASGRSKVSAEDAPPIAVTLGDPAGIGPDITLQAWARRHDLGLPAFVVLGDADILTGRARQLGLDVPLAATGDLAAGPRLFRDALPVLPVPEYSGPNGADGIVASIEQAVAAVAARRALALVTNPITKRSLDFAALPYPGHTEFLADLAVRYLGGARPRPVMMLAAEELKVVPATVHIPIASVPAALTIPLLRETIAITAGALVQDFGIAAPRIAVAGLNPHAGEDGLIGAEERRIIAPAIEAARALGVSVTGPHAADTLFHAEARRDYDAVVAMYHDQALIPLKTLSFDRGVNVTLGLPFVRTSPDHGTAFSIAGTGKARPTSFMAALRLAFDMGRRRAGAPAAATSS
jgi:4-hydroxythreonine-4-phosphate dehydrogenase